MGCYEIHTRKGTHHHDFKSDFWFVFPSSSLQFSCQRYEQRQQTQAACFDSLKNTVTHPRCTCISVLPGHLPPEHPPRFLQSRKAAVRLQNCTAAFMPDTMNCTSLVGQCRRGGVNAAILCSFPAKPGLNSQWKFKWLQELQKNPQALWSVDLTHVV